MAGRLLQLDFELARPPVTYGLPPIRLVVSQTDGLVFLNPSMVWSGRDQAYTGEEGLPSWQEFFLDPTKWWDYRLSKPVFQHPDLRHKMSKAALWPLDAGLKMPPGESVSGVFAAHGDQLEVAVCRNLCENGRITDAEDALNLLVQRGSYVDNNLFYLVLKRCIAKKDLVTGRRIHALTIECGYEGDAFLATHLIGLYASQGRLEEATRVFAKISQPSSQNWATIIFAYARNGEAARAIRLYRQMREAAGMLTNRIYVAVLKACATAGDLVAGKEVHADILASPEKPEIFVHTGLVDMYAKCGSLVDARSLFDKLPQRDAVCWNAMIVGYAQQGMVQEAIGLYNSMRQECLTPPDSFTFAGLLRACAIVGVGALHRGKQLHAEIEELGLQADVVIGTCLVDMYVKCGCLEDARRMFDSLLSKDVVTWNAMIAGYSQQGMGQEAFSLYRIMLQEDVMTPNAVTFVCLVQACASLGALPQGKQLHSEIEERGLQYDMVLGGSLVSMYAKCGCLKDAQSMFDRLPHKGVETWNAMLAGYIQEGMGHDALCLYSIMRQNGMTPNSVTFVCVLQACASLGALPQGQQLHGEIDERGLQGDLVLGGSLVNMYAKCGCLRHARSMFDRLPDKTVETWNAMLAGYAQQGMGQETLTLYNSMQRGCITPNSITFVCVLQACATVAALPLGKQLHAQIEEQGLQADLVVGVALLNMYSKCGSMSDSQKVLDSLPKRTIEAWNALIGGYARLGDSAVVFALVDKMRLEGIQPDGITFLSVLAVCSHSGLLEKGQIYFEGMRTNYGISPTVEHYTCMVDLLGRAGHLDEALCMAKTMPFPSSGSVWHTLLGACRKWNNIEIGQQAFESAVRIDRKDAGAHVSMANIYVSAKMWEEAKEMQARRVKSGAWKEPGQSWWTDLGGVVHTFVSGDKKHPESEGIYARLGLLISKMKGAGYVPHLHSSLRDIPDDQKESELCGHSEKLAIAHALNKTPEGTTILVAKNLRVCIDCHKATGIISKVENRTIICRDASRFHVYKEGKCSCGDYW